MGSPLNNMAAAKQRQLVFKLSTPEYFMISFDRRESQQQVSPMIWYQNITLWFIGLQPYNFK